MFLSYRPASDLQSKQILWIDSYGQSFDTVSLASLYARKFSTEGITLSLARPLSENYDY
jgi:hypothetical protein